MLSATARPSFLMISPSPGSSSSISSSLIANDVDSSASEGECGGQEDPAGGAWEAGGRGEGEGAELELELELVEEGVGTAPLDDESGDATLTSVSLESFLRTLALRSARRPVNCSKSHSNSRNQSGRQTPSQGIADPSSFAQSMIGNSNTIHKITPKIATIRRRSPVEERVKF